MPPSIVMEATGHYHSPVVQFLDEHQYLYKKTNLRRVKTDAADAYQLGTLYYKEEFEPYKKRGKHLEFTLSNTEGKVFQRKFKNQDSSS